MSEKPPAPASVDEYLAQCSDETRGILETLRREIKILCPEATEKISWAMPTFVYRGKNLVHFFGHKSHVGFYPGDSGVRAFEAKLANYRHSKGAIQFPYKDPIPYPLVREIVQFRMAENEEKTS